MPPWERALLMVSGRLKSIVKHGLWWLGKRVSCGLNDLYVLYDVFCARSYLLGVAIIVPALKFLVVLFFL